MIKIITFSDSYKHFDLAIMEYEKRLGREVEVIKLKPCKKGNKIEVIKQETNILKEKLAKEKGLKVVLNPVGKSFSTDFFLDFIEYKKLNYKNVVFCIGGAYGLNYKQLEIDFEMKLGDFTMPHCLALLVLLEQIYRIGMIKKGTSYHK